MKGLAGVINLTILPFFAKKPRKQAFFHSNKQYMETLKIMRQSFKAETQIILNFPYSRVGYTLYHKLQLPLQQGSPITDITNHQKLISPISLLASSQYHFWHIAITMAQGFFPYTLAYADANISNCSITYRISPSRMSPSLKSLYCIHPTPDCDKSEIVNRGFLPPGLKPTL